VRREIGDKKGIGDTLIDLGALYHDRGQHDEALKFFKESLQIQRQLGDEANQALCLNNIGSSYFFKGQYEDALTYFQQALQLREKSKNLPQTALTLHNLGETNANMGFYDQALTQYLRAIELYRAAGDARGAAIESYSMGTLFQHQGRYGAALSSKQEALRTFQQLKDRSFWMAEILSGYGSALAEAGRDEEAQKSLDEAMNLARELKNDALVAQVLDFQGDTFFYRGDYKSARALYERALSLASRAKDRDKILLSKFNLSKVALKEGRSQAAISSLRGLTEEADRPGLKYLPVECSIYVAEALVNTKDYSRARQELELALTKSEKLGLRTLLAKGHYLLATALRLTGKGSEASGHYREALRLLEEISKESGASNVLQRADLHPIYTDSAQWSRGGKG
jgi:tetratricopeptide (TPR) repeat protein